MAVTLFEVCVADIAGVKTAAEGGADRVELCAALEIGGITPSLGLVRAALEETLPVYVLIRPRGGDFVFSAAEVDVMLDDIVNYASAGVDGFAIGALTPERKIDIPTMTRLVEICGDRSVTLHRSFDHTRNPSEALEQAVDLGIERVLTSGGASSAIEGLEPLRKLATQAAGRILIMPGGGITPVNLEKLLDSFPATDVHASCRTGRMETDDKHIGLGTVGNGVNEQTDLRCVTAMSKLIRERA